MLLQEKWEDFMDKMGPEDLSDPMDELPEEVMHYHKDKEKYAIEELRAEMAGAFILSAAGAQVPESVSANNRAYIQGWAKDIQDAPNMLFQAIKDASTICDFVSARGELERWKEEISTSVPEGVSHGPIILDNEIEL